MNLSEAERILGVKAGASAEAVRAAFSVAVKDHHPDSHPLGGVIAQQRVAHGDAPTPRLWPMQALKDARDLLLARAGVTSTNAKPCPVCRGTGVQTIGLRRVPCVRGCEEG